MIARGLGYIPNRSIVYLLLLRACMHSGQMKCNNIVMVYLLQNMIKTYDGLVSSINATML